jgi:hypothetical protein
VNVTLEARYKQISGQKRSALDASSLQPVAVAQDRLRQFRGWTPHPLACGPHHELHIPQRRQAGRRRNFHQPVWYQTTRVQRHAQSGEGRGA